MDDAVNGHPDGPKMGGELPDDDPSEAVILPRGFAVMERNAGAVKRWRSRFNRRGNGFARRGVE
ncbi:MAG: hypothetical protein GX444_16785 [Myxococcales bacterium]|nr:hypothetical protein [Myxococcales bacterium]